MYPLCTLKNDGKIGVSLLCYLLCCLLLKYTSIHLFMVFCVFFFFIFIRENFKCSNITKYVFSKRKYNVIINFIADIKNKSILLKEYLNFYHNVHFRFWPLKSAVISIQDLLFTISTAKNWHGS